MEMRFFRKILIAALILPFIFTSSCEEIFPIVNCNECLDYEPYTATITVKTGSNYTIHGSVTINIYEGTDTSGEMIKTYYPSGEETTVELSLNKTYTFEAVYVDYDNKYRALNSVNPSVKYTDSECDFECWYIYNNKVDLRLKYIE